MAYIAAFDAGTTAMKGTLVNEAGETVVSCSAELTTLTRGGFQEQNPGDWWAAFCAITRQFAETVTPAEITGVIMSGQMQDLILLDGALEPVCPAILYCDGRAQRQAAALEQAVGAECFLRTTGNRCDGSLPLPKLMWLREQRPDLYRRTAHVLISSKDYLLARLTGVCAGDVTACATAGAMDIRRKRWDETLLAAAGADPALFPALYQPHQQVGAVLPAAEAECGLRAGTAVFAGIGDAGATTLASGIRAPGQYNINLGTSGWVAAVSEDILLSEAGVFNLAAAAEGCYINVVPFLNAGNVHRWMAGVLGRAGGAPDYETAAALLASSVPGSHGVLCLPYLCGERFPVLDGDIRGCWYGLSPETTAADLARSCLEGVAFSLRQGLERLPDTPVSVSLIGGGGQEPVWCQLLADVLGHAITVLPDTQFRAAQALASLVRPEQPAGTARAEQEKVYVPRREFRALYDGLYAGYRKLYPALRGL
ncbi:xylulokinase [Dysosmobacter sp.]|uniref:xylulokinase n=1 Tax=Dysosmobacter sp. TaxID=2591382 RepID=UPI002A8D3CE0|nr:FGGY family carbohydrate kinase [Dysosmobacter sp.]MDY3281074.1 FGGY family carbohydrate kinase [Dysosmobacter sp.]